MPAQLESDYAMQREILLEDLEGALQMHSPDAARWFLGEEDADQDEHLEQIARYLWCYPDATRDQALHWTAKQIVAYFEENYEHDRWIRF